MVELGGFLPEGLGASVGPDLDQGQLAAHRRALRVDQGSGRREVELRAPVAGVRGDVLEHGERRPGDLQGVEVEGHGVERGLADVNDVPGGDVPRVAAAAVEQLPLPGGEVDDLDARVVEAGAAGV